MNALIRLKKTTPVFVIALSLACVALLPKAQAVVPPPDGGYPGFNTAEGQNALFSLTSGVGNTAVGWFSLKSVTTGGLNTAVGAGSLVLNTGERNTATGALALLSNTTGTGNTAMGAGALQNNTNHHDNTAVGTLALTQNTGGLNTAIGRNALLSNTTGSGNTALGYTAGSGITGSGNICIGSGVFGVPGDNNRIRIGDNLPTGGGESACYIGGIAGQTVDPSGAGQVYVDNSGKLGVFLSSEGFKRDIQPMQNVSEAILALKPVTFHYKSDAKNTPCFGLIAEDVEKVNPDLVVRDKNGQLLSVRYEQINAMLLNEFLKAHRTVQEQKATIAQLKSTDAKQEAIIAQQQKQIDVLTAGLQKVSAQLEVSKSAPQTVLNNQ
jgi:hypothetical protein